MGVCIIEGCCKETKKNRRYCEMHRARIRRHGDPDKKLVYSHGDDIPKCCVEGCEDDAKKKMKSDTPMCIKHYGRYRSHGNPTFTKTRPQGIGTVANNGYVRIQVEGQHFFEHRVIMEEIIGRQLRPEEQVHHKNGIRHDNRPENLELWSSSHPSGQRIDDMVDWCIEFLRDYRPEVLNEKEE